MGKRVRILTFFFSRFGEMIEMGEYRIRMSKVKLKTIVLLVEVIYVNL